MNTTRPTKSGLVKTSLGKPSGTKPEVGKRVRFLTWFILNENLRRLEEFHVLETSEPEIMESLYAPFPKTSVTLYGPSQLAASFPCPGRGFPMLAHWRTRSPFSNLRGITLELYLFAIWCFRALSRICAVSFTLLARSDSSRSDVEFFHRLI